jgi:hypothetical protein
MKTTQMASDRINEMWCGYRNKYAMARRWKARVQERKGKTVWSTVPFSTVQKHATLNNTLLRHAYDTTTKIKPGNDKHEL